MWDHLLAIGIIAFVVLALLSGRDSGKSPRIWSGDKADEEARRNTRTDSNYRGYDHWNNPSDRGW